MIKNHCAITVTSHELNGDSDHTQLDYWFNSWFNSLFELSTKETSELHITGLYDGIPLVTSGSPHKRPVMRRRRLHMTQAGWSSDVICRLRIQSHILLPFVLLVKTCVVYISTRKDTRFIEFIWKALYIIYNKNHCLLHAFLHIFFVLGNYYLF